MTVNWEINTNITEHVTVNWKKKQSKKGKGETGRQFHYNLPFNLQQESIPVGCIPPTFLILWEGSPYRYPPGQRSTWIETPQDRDPLDRHLPGQKHLPDRNSLDRDPLDRLPGQRPPSPEITWDLAARQEVTSSSDHLVERMTDTRL